MARNPLSQLASLGEEVLEKAAQNPATAKPFGYLLQLKERTDDLARRVRGLEAMERRIEQLEKRLAKVEAGKRTTKPKPAAKT
ncbi:MAG TPA: hypothetical protein VGL84_05405 [Gaiellaceae bacterium]|jgi:hypothetical protein